MLPWFRKFWAMQTPQFWYWMKGCSQRESVYRPVEVLVFDKMAKEAALAAKLRQIHYINKMSQYWYEDSGRNVWRSVPLGTPRG